MTRGTTRTDAALDAVNQMTGPCRPGHDNWVNVGSDRNLADALADAVIDQAPAKTALVMAQLARLDRTRLASP